MERISCERQVVINSRIQPIDCALISTTNWGYLASQIEGTLEIYVNGRNFFSEPNILLIELPTDKKNRSGQNLSCITFRIKKGG